MKKIIVVVFLMLVIFTIAFSTSAHRLENIDVYLPFVQIDRQSTIDCMDANGNFIECP